ncbi:ATP-binding protein [Streptomyces sp. Li-HN-5-11]|uniref:ATP-binding protein n=1 Tax=Streptomyces sp. Li-HN-5-11 TaxID=3075432 RepID=UPI0028AEFAAF|nr:ATP-binding protein [Streptomyces sp. Li-HN-5-11]WNM32191.1 ATP-binding protein [Streptomyces sp. Li-HN-5-11]WOP39044.1 ATP-binding protein [Streptomyces sp. Li-HN-5-13]
MTVAQLDAAPVEGVAHVFPLPPAPGSVSAVRRRVRTVLGGWNLPTGAADDVLLVVSELVTNALVHARPPATLRLWRVPAQGGGAVRVEVTDQGPAAPPGPAAAPDPDEHGRGLGIVTALSARCGVLAHTGGTSRWAEVLAG